MSKIQEIFKVILMRKILNALVLGMAVSLSSALPYAELDGAAQDFWKIEQSSNRQMARAAEWLQKNVGAEVISAEMNDEIRAMIEDYYKLADRLQEFDSRFDRSMVGGGITEIFESLYGRGIFDGVDAEDLSNEELLDLLFGGLSDLLVFENLRFQFHAAQSSKLFLEKLNEIEVNGEKGHYQKLIENFMSRGRRVKFGKTLKLLDEARSRMEGLTQAEAPALYALVQRLDTSLSQEMLKQSSFWGRLSTAFRKYLFKLELRHHKRVDFVEYQLSKVFGNAAGALNIQKFLNSIPKETLKSAMDTVLQPGDVIVEKTAGAITDTFIPGHFGHVAVYVGRPDQLQDLYLKDGTRLVDHPDFKPHLEALERGETTVEAVRPGVQLEDISHWTITDMAVLRPSSYPKTLVAEALLKAVRYVGTAYDFAFDVNTESLIVCSELPYQVFKGIQFRTAKSAGRETISPDDVAVLGGPDGEDTPNRPFRVVHLIHKGQVVKPEETFPLYHSFMEKSRYDEVPENLHDYGSVE